MHKHEVNIKRFIKPNTLDPPYYHRHVKVILTRRLCEGIVVSVPDCQRRVKGFKT